MDRLQIMDQAGVYARLKRIAFEIYEQHFQASQLLMFGIEERGYFLAEEIAQYLTEISDLEVKLGEVHVDRSGEEGEFGIDIPIDLEELKGQVVVLVNDVLHTGRTLLNVSSILLHAVPSCIQTVVLINRGHRVMPVSSDYVGLELATTIHQHVSVAIDLEAREAAVFLE
ncbi:MAG: phosphoribosyltransferase family protein [Bacteroidota bacterium]